MSLSLSDRKTGESHIGGRHHEILQNMRQARVAKSRPPNHLLKKHIVGTRLST